VYEVHAEHETIIFEEGARHVLERPCGAHKSVMLCNAISVLCTAVPVLCDAVLVLCDAVLVLCDAVLVLCDAMRVTYVVSAPPPGSQSVSLLQQHHYLGKIRRLGELVGW
jgi:hypothetical protein